jgi:hypothetical protein
MMKVKFGAVEIEVWKVVMSIQRTTLFRFIYHDWEWACPTKSSKTPHLRQHLHSTPRTVLYKTQS